MKDSDGETALHKAAKQVGHCLRVPGIECPSCSVHPSIGGCSAGEETVCMRLALECEPGSATS